jgi:hypothetical protein
MYRAGDMRMRPSPTERYLVASENLNINRVHRSAAKKKAKRPHEEDREILKPAFQQSRRPVKVKRKKNHRNKRN